MNCIITHDPHLKLEVAEALRDLGIHITHTYIWGAYAGLVPPERLAEVKQIPGVESVEPDKQLSIF
jgi:hypothetical protein